jgi:hypothetical protein
MRRGIDGRWMEVAVYASGSPHLSFGRVSLRGKSRWRRYSLAKESKGLEGNCLASRYG